MGAGSRPSARAGRHSRLDRTWDQDPGAALHADQRQTDPFAGGRSHDQDLAAGCHASEPGVLGGEGVEGGSGTVTDDGHGLGHC